MSFLWYWPAGGWDFDAWKTKQDWKPDAAPNSASNAAAASPTIQSDQSGKADPLPLVRDGMTSADWQRDAVKWRKVSEQILGSLSDGPPTQFKYEKLGASFRTERYTMQRYRYTLTDEEWGYAWLLTPHERKTPQGAVIALHQTSCSGKAEVVGLDVVAEEQAGVTYAQEMANRGFVVLAPDAIAFGERQSAHRNAKYHSADEFFTAQPHGSVMLKMGFDTSRACDFLQQLPNLNVKKIACIGHSHGAYGTLFAMLADPRILAGVMSCGVSLLRDDPSPERWWRRTSLIPRLGLWEGNMSRTPIDFHIWLALIAPRPVMITGGLKDTIFPNQAALPGRIELVRKVYDLYNAGDALTSSIHDGPHQFTPEAREKAYVMLEKALS